MKHWNGFFTEPFTDPYGDRDAYYLSQIRPWEYMNSYTGQDPAGKQYISDELRRSAGEACEQQTSYTGQIGGAHYKNMAIQPIEFIQANNLGFEEGNVIKYVCRYKSKNGVEDLKKAVHYLQLLIEKATNEKH